MGIALDTIIGLGGKILDRVLPDQAARDAANLELLKLAQTGELAQLTAETDLAKGQIEVNKVESGSSNLFVSGWRPFIGWVCGFALCYTFILRPILNPWVVKWAGIPMEALDIAELMSLLFGMLGLSVSRTFEKTKGVTR